MGAFDGLNLYQNKHKPYAEPERWETEEKYVLCFENDSNGWTFERFTDEDAARKRYAEVVDRYPCLEFKDKYNRCTTLAEIDHE